MLPEMDRAAENSDLQAVKANATGLDPVDEADTP